MQFAVSVAVLLAASVATAAPPANYYATAEDKLGAELRAALHGIIRGHTVISYSGSGFDTSDALRVLDEDPANTNNVLLLYARRSEPKSNFGGTTGWNREHLWPNSYGLDDRHPAYSDLHNLRAEDIDANSARANKYFDLSATNHASFLFPAHSEATQCSTDFDSWHPPPALRGDIARAIFYMDVRYEGDVSGEPDLILTEGVQRLSSTTNFMGRLSTLLLWHEVDPVDAAERARNDKVFALYQRNRNPFVDRPEWAREIFWPRVNVNQAIDGNVVPTWSSEFTNSVLQSALTVPGEWLDRGTGVQATSQTRILSDIPSGSARFYRLRLW
jgi:endonuclease I